MSLADTAQRLLRAIEQFAEQEHLALRAGDGRRAQVIQGRAAPLIGRLCQLGASRPSWWTPALSRRVEEIVRKRRANRGLVAARREELRAQRERLAGIRGRLTSVAPAYVRAAGGGRHLPRLNAAV